MTTTAKSFLGDGAYVEFDGYGYRLTTENGITKTNEIYLEPEGLQRLINFRDNIKEQSNAT